MDDGAGRRFNKRVKIGAFKGLDIVPVCHEKGTRGHKGTLSYILRQIIVELLGIGRPGRGRNSQNQRPDGMEDGWWGQHPERAGQGRQIIQEGWQIPRCHREKLLEATINEGQGGGQGR
jgi:hypothetical protein